MKIPIEYQECRFLKLYLDDINPTTLEAFINSRELDLILGSNPYKKPTLFIKQLIKKFLIHIKNRDFDENLIHQIVNRYFFTLNQIFDTNNDFFLFLALKCHRLSFYRSMKIDMWYKIKEILTPDALIMISVDFMVHHAYKIRNSKQAMIITDRKCSLLEAEWIKYGFQHAYPGVRKMFLKVVPTYIFEHHANLLSINEVEVGVKHHGKISSIPAEFMNMDMMVFLANTKDFSLLNIPVEFRSIPEIYQPAVKTNPTNLRHVPMNLRTFELCTLGDRDMISIGSVPKKIRPKSRRLLTYYSTVMG